MNKFISYVLLIVLAGYAAADAKFGTEVDQFLSTHENRCYVYTAQVDLAKQVIELASPCWQIVQNGSIELYEIHDYDTYCKQIEAIAGEFDGAHNLSEYAEFNAPDGDLQKCYGRDFLKNISLVIDAESELERLFKDAE